jgi:hypothetical protein
VDIEIKITISISNQIKPVVKGRRKKTISIFLLGKLKFMDIFINMS